MSSFDDPQAVARYAESSVRRVPGFHDLQRMVSLLLAEFVPDDGYVLALGAGGSMELKRSAEKHPTWRFVGVDTIAARLLLRARSHLADQRRSRRYRRPLQRC